MSNRLESKYLMNLSIQGFVNKFLAVLLTLPGFAELYALFQANIEKMQGLRQVKETNTSGVGKSDGQLKTKLIDQALDLIRKVVAYAGMNNNEILAKEVYYSKSNLEACSKAKLRDRCQLIYDKASANLKPLTDYYVNAETLDAFKVNIDLFSGTIPNTRLNKNTKKTVSSQLAQLQLENDKIIDKFDLLIEILHNTQSEIYNGYKNISHVVETTKSPLAAKCSVIDAETKLPLKGVSFVFALEGTMAKQNGKLEKKSAPKGGLHIKSLAEGVYHVTVSKIGYVTQELKLIITNGELSYLEVALVKG